MFFAFQIYGDFSGYSDIAIGTSKLFGFNLMRNFAYPYFSRSIAEFWRRWHISLSTWFRDYLYIPLGGSRGNKIFQLRNTLIIFLVSGFWHGANWTFIVWGAIHAFYFIPLLMGKKNRNYLDIVAEKTALPSFKEFFSMLITFVLTTLAWVFFRAENITKAGEYLSGIFSVSFFSIPVFANSGKSFLTLILLILFIVLEWVGRREAYALKNFGLKWKRPYRWLFYYLLLIGIFWMGGNEQQFIYFQF